MWSPVVLVASLLSAPAQPSRPANVPAAPFAIDLMRTPAKVTGGVRRFAGTSIDTGNLIVRLRGGRGERPGKWGEVLFDLRGTRLARVPWNNRTRVTAELRVSPAFVGTGKRNWYRPHRARLFAVDGRGRRLYLPHILIVDRPASTGGWLELGGQPTADLPMPLGFTERGFDADQIVGLGLNIEACNREAEKVMGRVELRNLRVAFGPAMSPRILTTQPSVLGSESKRAAAMENRLAERAGLVPGQLAVGVNLAWPSARSPAGEEMQLYGRTLDGGTPWWDHMWDLGEEAVATSVRTDFREIRATFGVNAPVRIWLFGDLRSGIDLDDEGDPEAVSARARDNMQVLLRLATEEQVLLIPVLLDFHLADGLVRSGPDGAWELSERPDLITDARKRGKLVKAMEDFVRLYADHDQILVWDVMNEPENAVSVVTPAYFADLQSLIYELVEAVHRAGDLATVGHRNAADPAAFFRGRVASDFGQAHYYPFVDTRPNPTPFAYQLPAALGPLPTGWGEAPARPGAIAAQIAAAQRAGHRLLLFWSWRGHGPSGDGFPVKPYAPQIRRALSLLRHGR